MYTLRLEMKMDQSKWDKTCGTRIRTVMQSLPQVIRGKLHIKRKRGWRGSWDIADWRRIGKRAIGIETESNGGRRPRRLFVRRVDISPGGMMMRWKVWMDGSSSGAKKTGKYIGKSGRIAEGIWVARGGVR
jgi:hypothetical protein